MNKEVLTNKEVSDALHMLFHCARKDSNYETQYKQFRLVYDYINQLEKEVERLKEREKLVTEHYDVMVRHAGNLEGKIVQLETNRDEAIEYIKKYKYIEKVDLIEAMAYGIPESEVVEAEELLSILERGKE